MTPPPDRMLRLFAYEHLQRDDLRSLAKRFSMFAHELVEAVPPGPERTVALRKLLEAKDAAIRAVAIPELPPFPKLSTFRAPQPLKAAP